jgi:hypothetical protein
MFLEYFTFGTCKMKVIMEWILVHLMDSSREKGIKLLIDVFHFFVFLQK